MDQGVLQSWISTTLSQNPPLLDTQTTNNPTPRLFRSTGHWEIPQKKEILPTGSFSLPH